MTIDVRDHGAIGDGVADDTAAILAAQAALAAGEPLLFPVGVYRCSATLTAQTIIGDSRVASVLLYTGTEAAVSVVDPTVRSHNKRISDLAIVTPSAGDVALDGVLNAGTPATGTVGLDLTAHSRAHISNVTLAGFGTGALMGGLVLMSAYNTFVDVVAGACQVGFDVNGFRANENRFLGSRVNGCPGVGWRIYAGDRNEIIGGAVESSGDGVVITGADADGTVIAFNRFENNTGRSVYVAPEVPDVTIVDNTVYPSSGVVEIHSPRRVYRDSHRPYADWRTDRGDKALIWERNAASITSTPMAILRDMRTDGGNPTTLQLEQGRWSGAFLRGVRPQDGAEMWRVNGDGIIKPRHGTSPPSASPAGPGGMYYHTGKRQPLFSDGSVWRYADGTPY